MTADERPTRGMRTLIPGVTVAVFAVLMCDAALLTILLPSQVEAIDPDAKVTNLATVTTVSFLFTIFAQPLVGALSDRTRSVLGRRTPWILLCGVVAAAFLVGVGGLGSVLWICVFWTIVQFALNGVTVAVTSFVPDRVERSRRGRASAWIGLGSVAGGAGGTLLAGVTADTPRFASLLLGCILMGATILCAVLVREGSSRGRPRLPGGFVRFVRQFALDPRRHPDFAWAFAARFAFIAGYYLIYTFQLYLLVDHIRVDPDEAGLLLGELTVVSGLAIVVGVVVGGVWSDRIGRRAPFLLAACAVMVLALLVPLVWPTVAGMTVFFAAKGLAFGGYLACGRALVSEILPGGDTAVAQNLGVYNVATNVPQALAPAGAALLIGVWGYPALFVAAIVGVCASALLMARVDERRGRAAAMRAG